MKRTILICLSTLVPVLFALATPRSDALAYLDALNAKWVAKDYFGLKSVTDSRLAQTSNGDLAALIETCIYHSFFDYNTTIISQYVPKAQTLITLIDWTENERTKIFVEAGIGEVSAPQEAIADGIIYGATDNEIEGFHSESPTEYPNLILLRMIVDVQYPE